MCKGVKLHFEVAGLSHTSDQWQDRSPGKSGYESRDNPQRVGMYTKVRDSPQLVSVHRGLPSAESQDRITVESLGKEPHPQAVYSLQDARSGLETLKMGSEPQNITDSPPEFTADKRATSKKDSISDREEPALQISNPNAREGDRKLGTQKDNDQTSLSTTLLTVREISAEKSLRSSETGKTQTISQTPASEHPPRSLFTDAPKSDGNNHGVGAQSVAKAIAFANGDRVNIHEDGGQKEIQASYNEKRKLTPSKAVIPALPKALKMTPKINSDFDASTIQAGMSATESVITPMDKQSTDDTVIAGINDEASCGKTAFTWPKVGYKPDEDVSLGLLAEINASTKMSDMGPDAMVSIEKDKSPVELYDHKVFPETDKFEMPRNHANDGMQSKPDIIKEAARQSNPEDRSDHLQRAQVANNSKAKISRSSTESLPASYQPSKPSQAHGNPLDPGRLRLRLDDLQPQPSESQCEGVELKQTAIDQPQKESRGWPEDDSNRIVPQSPGEIWNNSSSQDKHISSKQTVPAREIAKSILIAADLTDWQKEYQQVMDLVKTATGPAKAAWTQETEKLRKGLVDAEALLADLEARIPSKKTAKKNALKKVKSAVESHKRNAEELSLLYGRILRDAEEKLDKAKAYPALHESDARYRGVSARRQASSDHCTISRHQAVSQQQTFSNSDSSDRTEHPFGRAHLYNVTSSSGPVRPGDVFASDTVEYDTPSIDSVLDRAVAGRSQLLENMTVQSIPGQSGELSEQGTVVILVIPNASDYFESCQVDTRVGNPKPAVDRGLNNYGQLSPFDYLLRPQWSPKVNSEIGSKPVRMIDAEGSQSGVEHELHQNGQQDLFEDLVHPRPSSDLHSAHQSGPVNMSYLGDMHDDVERGPESHERQASIDGVIDPLPRAFSDIVRPASPPAWSLSPRWLDMSNAPAVQATMQTPTGNENVLGRPLSPSTVTSSLLSVRPSSPTADAARPSSPTYADIAKSKGLANGSDMERRTSNASNGSSAPLARRPSNIRGKMGNGVNPAPAINGKVRATSPSSRAGNARDRTMSPEGRNEENRKGDDWKVGPEGEWGRNGLRLRGVPPVKGG